MSNHPRHRPDFLSNQTEQHDLNILVLDQLPYPARNHTLDRHFHAQISRVFQLHFFCHKCTFRGGIAATPKSSHIVQVIAFGYGAHKICREI